MLLEGLHIPLTTPFHPDGRLNPHKLAANVLRYSLTPAAGLIILGPSGEPTLLSDDETREALRTAAEAASPEKILVAGIARDSVHSTLDLATFAADQNYDAVLIPVSAVLALSQTAALLTFFRAIADRSPLPLVLLSTPQRPIPVETASELAAHLNIVGLLAQDDISTADLVAGTTSIKQDVTVTHVFAAVTGRMQRSASRSAASLISPASLTTAVAEAPAKPALRTRSKSVGFQIISGNTSTMLDALNDGATGIAPAFAAAAPQACYEVYAAWKDQDQPLASEKQQRLLDAARLVEPVGPAALKFAADLNGYFGGLPRLPHLPLSGEQRSATEVLMKPLRN